MPIVLLMLSLLAGCYASARYAITRPGLDCERATRVTHRALTSMGYEVTTVYRPSPARPGYVEGTIPGPKGRPLRHRVNIRCAGDGAVLQPVEEEAIGATFEFSRKFRYAFLEMVQRPDVEVPREAAGLQVLVERIDSGEATLDLGSNPTVGGAVLVRVTVRNFTDRAVALSASGVELSGPGRSPAMPLAGSALAGALDGSPAAGRVRAELLDRLQVAARQTQFRFLVYPPGAYADAQVSVDDVETGESEGFSSPVQ